MEVPQAIAASPNPFFAALVFFSPIPSDRSAGFQARLIVLGCVLASLPVLSTAVMVCYIVASRRRQESLWLFRRVRRENGSYIVGNRIVLLCLSAITLSVVYGTAELLAWRFISSGGIGLSAFLACLFSFWATYFLTSVLLAFSNFQSWLIVSRKLGPRISNTIFLGALVVGTAGLLVVAIYGSWITNQFTPRFAQLFETLALQALTFDGTLSAADGLQLQAIYQELSLLQFDFYDVLADLVFGCAFTPLTVLLLNLAGLSLVVTVRRQRQANRSIEEEVSIGTLSGFNEKTMKAVERALLVDSCLLAVWSSALMVVSFLGSTALRSHNDKSWVSFETTLFSTLWVAGVPFSVALVAQAVIAFQNLPKRKRTLGVDSVLVPSFVRRSTDAPTKSSEGLSGGEQELYVKTEADDAQETGQKGEEVAGRGEVELGEDLGPECAHERVLVERVCTRPQYE